MRQPEVQIVQGPRVMIKLHAKQLQVRAEIGLRTERDAAESADHGQWRIDRRLDALSRIGGYDDSLVVRNVYTGEDAEFFLRIVHQGKSVCHLRYA